MIYFDSGATTYPKPNLVKNRVIKGLNNYSFNSGRGGYRESLASAEMIFGVREKIGTMFNFEPQNIVFTPNCTFALNMAIKGSVKKGEHIIISSLEHNSVSRCVEKLKNDLNISYDIARYSFDEDETVNNFKKLIRPNTSLIVCIHASNVFGVVFPIERIGKLAKENGIRFIVDTAQSAGILDIDSRKQNIDILCAPGHKGLYGPMGTGFMAVQDGIHLDTIVEGGTGSNSLSLVQPDSMPDRFESGTLNNIGIIGLGAGVDFVNQKGLTNIYNHELKLTNYLYDSLNKIENVIMYTPRLEYGKNCPILSFNIKNLQSEEVAMYLANNNIAVRAGYHCSPLSHKHFGTLKTGTVRICPSVFNNLEECKEFINILKKH